MERITQEEKEFMEAVEVLEEFSEEDKEMLQKLEILDKEWLYIEDTLEEIEKSKEKPEMVKKLPKELIYFSNSIFIFRFVYRQNPDVKSGYDLEPIEYPIYQVYDRDTRESTYHYINDERMEKSLLLNLINRGEGFANKKKYI